MRAIFVNPVKLRRTLLAASLAILAFLAVGIYEAGKNELPPPNMNSTVTFYGGQVAGNRIRFHSWSAEYSKIVTDQNQIQLDVQGIRNGTIYKNGKPYLRVRADRFTVNTQTHDFTAVGPLHVETISAEPHRAFDATQMTWFEATQTLTFPKRVTIWTGAENPLIVGSLTFNVRTGQLEMRNVAGPVRFK